MDTARRRKIARLFAVTHRPEFFSRYGFTPGPRQIVPEKIERDLQALLEPAEWTPFSMRLILHGRTVCRARKPRCEVCVLAADCPRIGVAVVPQARIKAKRSKGGTSKNRV